VLVNVAGNIGALFDSIAIQIGAAPRCKLVGALVSWYVFYEAVALGS
jgi:hypothetical protein